MKISEDFSREILKLSDKIQVIEKEKSKWHEQCVELSARINTYQKRNGYLEIQLDRKIAEASTNETELEQVVHELNSFKLNEYDKLVYQSEKSVLDMQTAMRQAAAVAEDARQYQARMEKQLKEAQTHNDLIAKESAQRNEILGLTQKKLSET